jgi:hypothetical protein
MSSINGHRIMQKLHSFTQNNGDLNELTWSTLIITPNFYKLFIYLYPNYVFTNGDIQIFIALTQFIPRVLEQCYMLYFIIYILYFIFYILYFIFYITNLS